MKKLIILPFVLLFSLINPVVLAVPSVSPEKEADFISGLLQFWGESVPDNSLLNQINDPDTRELVNFGYEICDMLIEVTNGEDFLPSELIQTMLDDEDQELKEYAEISRIAVTNLCPNLP